MSDDPKPISEALERVRRQAEARTPRPEPERDPADAARARRDRDRERRCQMLGRFDGQLPDKLRRAELADVDPRVRAELSSWAQDPAGRNLLIVGPVGVGKSMAAVCAIRLAITAHGTPARFEHVPELLDRLRPGGPEGLLDQVVGAGLLLLDDIGAERPTDWTADQLAHVIAAREARDRPTVATTNLTVGPTAQLVAHLGERSYSRLVGSGAVVIQITGIDRRLGR